MWSGIDWITVVSDSGGFTISMSERQGIAPRGDALENSFGHRVMELRDDAGNARIKLLAATYGDDVTATRIGAGAASFAPSDGCVLLIGGGSGALPAGLGGLAAVPVELDLAGGAVDRAGIPLEMAASAPGRVRVRRAGRSPGLRAVGLSAAPAYEDGGTTVVPLATAGLLEVRVRAARAGVPLGAPLHISGDDELAVADRGATVIVARAAQTSESTGVVTLHAWVAPAQLIDLQPPAPDVD